MFRKLLASLTLVFSLSAAAEVNQLPIENFKTESFKYAGENDILKMYINKRLVYKVTTNNYFDEVRAAPIRMELKSDQEDEKAGTTFISYMYFDCINKSNMILFVHVYDQNGKFVREERNTELVWNDTIERTNTRMLNEYICK